MDKERSSAELECLQAMYPEEFSFIDQERMEFRLKLEKCTVEFRLPESYLVTEHIIARVSNDSWPDATAQKAQTDVDMFIASLPLDTEMAYDVTLFIVDCLEIDLTRKVRQEVTDVGNDVAAFSYEDVTKGLQEAGFENYGDVWAYPDKAITIEIDAEANQVFASIDGICQEDVDEYVAMQLRVDASSLGRDLMKWTRASSDEAAPGFDDDDDECPAHIDLQYIPSPEDMGVKVDRDLTILTWGRAFFKQPPARSQRNFNAGVLTGRGGGVNLRRMNGLSEEIQARVSRCSLFPSWITMVIRKIEEEDYQTISINCTKGRHRSVAAAEILRSVYYQRAKIEHMTIV